MSEQQTTSACPHPEAVGERWGDPISEDRQKELQGYLDRWAAKTDHGERKGPFDKGPGQRGVHLTGADVFWLAEQRKHGEGGHVRNLHLEGAYLFGAQLKGADLSKADLESTDLGSANLEGANLRGAWFDSKTVLGGSALDRKTGLGDIHWDGIGTVDLTQINWFKVRTLADEQGLSARSSIDDREAPVRAYRQLAAQLRAQGMNEVADRFLYRSQKWQRRVLLRQGKLGGYLFSLLLAALSGYGYRIWRIFATYALTVAAFAAIFYWIGIPNDPATTMQGHAFNALLVSLTAIHGRTFFEQFAFTAQGWVAAIESIIGIVIEGVFVAMLIQRFFGR